MAAEFPDRSTALEQIDPVREIVFEHLDACSIMKGKKQGQLNKPECVAIDPATNHIYVTERDSHPYFARVSIFSESGDFLSNFPLSTHFKSVIGIAIHGDNLYVTDWVLHAVVQIKIGLDFCLGIKTGSYGSDMGQFKSPRQLSISTNGDIYIADCRNDRIQILDSSLHPIRAIKHPSMNRPCDVKLTTNEIYVLSFEDNPCVHVFSYTGHKIRSLITRGEGIQANYPVYFCLDASRRVIISFNNTHQIKIFSSEGALLHTLGQRGEDIGMFTYPTGLAITSNHKLVTLSYNSSNTLQIFSPL